MNFEMKDITASQKKIIIISAISIVALLIFWISVYMPSRNNAIKTKSELSNVEAQIQEIEAIIGKDKTINEGMIYLRERYEYLNNKFPEKEEESLRMLSNFAREMNVEILSIKPQQKRTFLDENKKEVKIEGKACQRVFVRVEMRCACRNLIGFIETLRESLPTFISIESLSINKDKRDLSLKTTLGLNLHLLCKI